MPPTPIPAPNSDPNPVTQPCDPTLTLSPQQSLFGTSLGNVASRMSRATKGEGSASHKAGLSVSNVLARVSTFAWGGYGVCSSTLIHPLPPLRLSLMCPLVILTAYTLRVVMGAVLMAAPCTSAPAPLRLPKASAQPL